MTDPQRKEGMKERVLEDQKLANERTDHLGNPVKPAKGTEQEIDEPATPGDVRERDAREVEGERS